MEQINSKKTGILLINLGTPNAPTPAAVRQYLAEFLSDPRVIEIPKLLWWPILHGIILRVRPKRSAELYKKIWTDSGSPLLVNSQHLTNAVQKQLDTKNASIIVKLGMRYGQPSIAQALTELQQADIQQLVILPLYPQYSATTTASSFDAVFQTLKTWRSIPDLTFISHYYADDLYLAALTQQIQSQWTLSPTPKHLLFSFHGLPQRFVDAGDPYQQQCHSTANALAQRLQLSKDQWSIAFQSRFGRAQWLQPYCDVTLRHLATTGKKNVLVVCPGFAVDCLETLEEMAIQNREIFLAAGGEQFTYIPALNATASHAQVLSQLLLQHLKP